MLISALCIFGGDCPDYNPDAAAEALRQAGYQVFRLPPELKDMLDLEVEDSANEDDFIEVRRETDNEDAMWDDAERIVSPFGGYADCCGPASEEPFFELTDKLRACCGHCGSTDGPLTSVGRAWVHKDCLKPWFEKLGEAPDEDDLIPF